MELVMKILLGYLSWLPVVFIGSYGLCDNPVIAWVITALGGSLLLLAGGLHTLINSLRNLLT